MWFSISQTMIIFIIYVLAQSLILVSQECICASIMTVIFISMHIRLAIFILIMLMWVSSLSILLICSFLMSRIMV